MKRIGVDIGGTFTDIVYFDDDSAEVIIDKVRSTPQDVGPGGTGRYRKNQSRPVWHHPIYSWHHGWPKRSTTKKRQQNRFDNNQRVCRCSGDGSW